MPNTETGWTKQERDDLARTIAESDITDGQLENADIDALVDLFEAWTERRSPSDAEQLSELQRLARRLMEAAQFSLSTPGLIRGRDQLKNCVEAVAVALTRKQEEKEAE